MKASERLVERIVEMDDPIESVAYASEVMGWIGLSVVREMKEFIMGIGECRTV